MTGATTLRYDVLPFFIRWLAPLVVLGAVDEELTVTRVGIKEERVMMKRFSVLALGVVGICTVLTGCASIGPGFGDPGQPLRLHSGRGRFVEESDAPELGEDSL
jgi:predicted small secreted protein